MTNRTPGSGDAALQAAQERAAHTRTLNVPQFDDLPISADTANLRLGPNLHDQCLALLPLVGVWRGEGEIQYSSDEAPRRFGQQITFAHDGRPFLYYEARSWLLDEKGAASQADREVGWWRVQPDDSIEVLLAHSSGVMEFFYGKNRNQTSWEFATDAVIRSTSAKEVTAAQRLYGIVEGGDLAYVDERAMSGENMRPHASARLTRIVG